MNVQWYALRSKPMKEAFLCAQLGLYNIDSYYPSIRVQPANPRARKFRPYFPGYVFGRVDFKQISISRLLWIPGLAGLVSFGGIPSYVPDDMIGAIRGRVDEINAAGGERLDQLKPGDVVLVREGPFQGYEAIVDSRLSGEARVRILLKLLNRPQVPLELPRGQIQRIKQ